MTSTPVITSYWVKEGRLLAGAYPGGNSAGQTRTLMNFFLDAGITVFIDLTHPHERVPYDSILYEQARLRGVEATYARFPIQDRDVPPQQAMKAILDAIDNALNAGRNVYVHCWGGVGRTGTTVGCYLVRHGMTGQEALEHIVTLWKETPQREYFLRSPETDEQVEYILNWRESSSSAKINWHARFTQQAAWTRELRKYIFEKAGLSTARRVLEVGCGTGAIWNDLQTPASLHGMDLDPAALTECRIHAPAVSLARGDALSLPYPAKTFDIAYCHYLLLWVKDPLQVLREMARAANFVIAFAEPDYSQRVDEPDSMKRLGALQTESLMRQGADVTFGARLAETFFRAGIHILETGPIQGQEKKRSMGEWENEWAVIQSDLAASVPGEDIQKMKRMDEAARLNGTRMLHVPTFFAWGRA